MAYRQRVVDSVVVDALASLGAVLLEGPKACGKTATGLHHSRSSLRLDTDLNARRLIDIEPAIILEGDVPRLIDEWQVEPRLWNHIRHAIDDRQATGQFILAGSAQAADDVTRHSGAGRIARVRMRPMSLFESGHSPGTVSLQALLNGHAVQPTRSTLTVHDVAVRTCAGGWPGLLDLNAAQAQRAVDSYVSETTRTDITTVDGVRRDPTRVRRLMVSLARNTATQVSTAKLAAEASTSKTSLHQQTAADYLDALARLMITEDLPAWASHLRSKTRLRNSPTRHFVDPSIAVSALGASPEKLLADLETFGFLFESLAVRDLRVYSQPLDADLSHYRDESGLEVDAVVTCRDGRWAGVEVKLADSQADAAATSLLKFRDRVDTSKVGEPAALVVVTAGQYAYTRPDGVHVVPLGVLGP
jgi:predicted AAA+ superfamily ATPase